MRINILILQLLQLRKSVLFFSVLLCSTMINAADESGWRLDRDKDGIKIYSREVPGSPVREMRGTVEINSGIKNLESMIGNVEERKKWDEFCREIRHETIGEDKNLIYVHVGAPWPASDRDMLSHREIVKNPANGEITITEFVTKGLMPERKGIVRITEGTTLSRLIPVNEKLTRLEFQYHMEPGGPVPAWLINQFAVDGPYKTLQRMRESVEHAAVAQNSSGEGKS
jgi:hypothetical protein